MYSQVICCTLETLTQESKLIKDNDPGLKLYKIELLKYQESVAVLKNLLSSSERDRASRYHFVKDEHRFIICRSLLKVLLAEYIGLHVDTIFLDIDSNKKPYISSHPSVYFNVSHSGNYALIAIAKSPIGIDIEYVNKSFDFTEILPNVFSQTEINYINNSNNKRYLFYQFWTRKEAIVKAIGKGIDDELFKIPVTDGSHLISPSIISEIKNINVFSFNLNDDYVGALALTQKITDFSNIVFSPIPSPDQLKSLIN